MKKSESWEYVIEVVFNKQPPRPGGLKMFFNDFSIAAERMMTFGKLHVLDDSSYGELAGDRRVHQMKLLSTKDGSVEMERRLVPDESGDLPVGLYYHFPKGLACFEKKSGLSFAGYKGYDGRNAFIQTSYMDRRSGHYEDLIAHEAMMEYHRQERWANPYFSATISREYFETGFPDQMDFHPEPFTEVFFDRDPNVVIKKLLEIDFNQLDKSVAWENELDGFVVRASVESVGIRGGSLKSYRRHFHHDTIKTPGIYLELVFNKGKREKVTLFKENLKPIGFRENIYKVGHYNELGTFAEKAPETLRALGGIRLKRNPDTGKNVQVAGKRAPVKKVNSKSKRL